ncbi:hypothetical protein EUX98_g3168 [Antrodiella citrinella]|uniref:Small nuclear ribonucleoprotein Prp3 C-terminal domain-containing protein n=1 Tax=Antrodiella citrinella TaxID=2447956 RepID=A0A4S4N5H1_9APHY|nr:hypothetical protein EUX98_g3168 [Antrodiella citrinella]
MWKLSIGRLDDWTMVIGCDWPRTCSVAGGTINFSRSRVHAQMTALLSTFMSSLCADNITRQLEELTLLKCSLLHGEELSFIPPSNDSERWQTLLDAYPGEPSHSSHLGYPESAAKVQVKSSGIPLRFEVQIPSDYGAPGTVAAWSEEPAAMVAVRGDQISRADQERWQRVVRECAAEVVDSEYPVYELMSSLLLRLHEAETTLTSMTEQEDMSISSPNPAHSESIYHALLTSHHLVSPSKRRNLQSWSSQLSISGFAKVGYPGIIYCEGLQRNVEEFVANIKAMQWLALKVRFVEPLPSGGVVGGPAEDKDRKRWTEFEKVGEVVQEMKKLRRDNYVVEMGIGSAGT